MTMADTIAVMRDGQVEQLGGPVELYEHPRTEFVANFLGQSNLLEGAVTARDGTDAVVDVHGTDVRVPAARLPGSGGRVRIGVRPEKLDLVTSGSDGHAGRRNTVAGTLLDSSFIGVSTQYLVETPWGAELMVFSQNRAPAPDLAPGTDVHVTWDPDQTFVLSDRADQPAEPGAEPA